MEELAQSCWSVPVPAFDRDLLAKPEEQHRATRIAHSIPESSLRPPGLGRSHSRSSSSLISAGLGSFPTPRSLSTCCRTSSVNGTGIGGAGRRWQHERRGRAASTSSLSFLPQPRQRPRLRRSSAWLQTSQRQRQQSKQSPPPPPPLHLLPPPDPTLASSSTSRSTGMPPDESSLSSSRTSLPSRRRTFVRSALGRRGSDRRESRSGTRGASSTGALLWPE